MDKLFINSDDLLKDSFQLAWKVYESGFKPNYIVGVWRGGAPIGIAVQEFLSVLGIKSDHVAIRTSHYSAIDAPSAERMATYPNSPLSVGGPVQTLFVVLVVVFQLAIVWRTK